MSEEKELTKKVETDLSERDLDKVKEFIEKGLPGLATLGDTKFQRMVEMYMGGSTYTQISQALELKKPIILYLSHHYQWYPAKQEYLRELQEKMKYRIIDAKLTSQDTLLLILQAYQKRLSHNLKKYLATNDPDHMDKINLKEIDKFLKTIETIQELSSDGTKSKGKAPAVGLNLGDGVTIERSGDNKVTITPSNNNQIKSLIEQYANDRRAKENSMSYDINKEEEENDEKN